jgi:type II secretory pathway pseudopilin PulG
MTWRRASRGERGASLILAIVFMVVVGGVSLITLSYITNGTNQRRLLEQARNREYAADGTIEQAIARVRALPAPGAGVKSCGGPDTQTLNGFNIRVDCQNASTFTTRGLLQRNVIFTACEARSAGAHCSDGSTVVRAQVNFKTTPGPGQSTVTRTYVQSWSVNR